MKRDWIIAALVLLLFAVLMEVVMVKCCGCYSVCEAYRIFSISREQGCGLREAAHKWEEGR